MPRRPPAAAAITVESYEIDLDLTGRRSRSGRVVDRSGSGPPSPAPTTFVEVKLPPTALGDASTARRSTRRRSTATGCRCRPAGADNTLVGRGRDGVLQHGRGAAPVRRPGRRRGLPLRDVVPRRRAAHLRLLRPARPQGAGDPHGDRAAGVDGGRPTARCVAGPAPGRWEFAADRAAGDLLRHADRRAVPRACGPSTTASRWRSTAGVAGRAPRQGRRRDLRDHPRVPRPVPRAVRRALPVRQVRPGVRARVQRRRDGEPGPGHVPRRATCSARRSPTPSASCGPRPSRTRWRTCGSATWSPCAGGTTCG